MRKLSELTRMSSEPLFVEVGKDEANLLNARRKKADFVKRRRLGLVDTCARCAHSAQVSRGGVTQDTRTHTFLVHSHAAGK